MRNKKVDYETFQQIESHLNGLHREDEHGFYRRFKFEALGVKYVFEFFKNLCTLYIGHTQIKFTHISLDGCWPNRYKTNLNLGSETDVYAVIPIEEYDYRKKNEESKQLQPITKEETNV